MDSENHQLHVMFLPYIAPGHMVPMVDMARLFAANGVRVTIITTTMNALRFQNAIDRDSRLGREIFLDILRFPALEAGLPEGCENLISTPTPEMSMKLFPALKLLRPEIENLFRERSPDCIVSDNLFPWTAKVSWELGIPRLAFTGSGFINDCISHSLELHHPHENVESEMESFIVPGLPDEIKLTRSQLPDIVKKKTGFSAMFEELKEAERNSFGVLFNSFYELEPAYSDYFREVIGRKAWHLGPLSLYYRDIEDKAERGDKSCVSKHSCLSWLDSRKPNSVLYICFGSLTRFSKAQIIEIAAAITESGHSFIWVVGKILKMMNDNDQQDESWLPEGFENEVRRNDRGLIIKGWAPQVLILEHQAIGGFLTHCGWNSILEGVSACVPMVTWPLFADQFYNEKLVTQVLKFGVPVGNDVWKIWATEESRSPVISREKIRRAICAAMDEDGEDGVEMRKRANHLGELARKAVEEGGSSYNDIKALIQDIRLYKWNNNIGLQSYDTKFVTHGPV
ncbi:Glycosyltransferase [Melia azedarach]|uniref:Glycosyltransferase n=1 Tax=Melia azedarach TaxID=155640 RepID=A0ACC1YLZ3_MELAZ|nr:Glycosyltransferase [Melia azedarach]